MALPPSSRFIDCDRLYTQHVQSEERTFCCPTSVRASVRIDDLIILLLPRSDLPDDATELLALRITHRGQSSALTSLCSGTVIALRDALSEEALELLGQDGIEPSVTAGEALTFELRHVAFVVDGLQQQRSGTGGRVAEASPAQRQREERRKEEEARAATVSGAAFIPGSRIHISKEQRREEEQSRKAAAAEDSDGMEHCNSVGSHGQCDDFDYSL